MRASLTLAICLLTTATAAAESDDDFVAAGLDLGWTGDGPLVGAEVGLTHFEGWLWGGVFVAPTWDADRERGRLTLGLHGGWGPVGVDAGLSSDTDGALGGQVRGLLTTGVVALYGGWAFGPIDRAEFGLLLKAPLLAW